MCVRTVIHSVMTLWLVCVTQKSNMYGVNGLRRMLVKEAFISVAAALAFIMPIKLFYIDPNHEGRKRSLDFGEQNHQDLGSSLMK